MNDDFKFKYDDEVYIIGVPDRMKYDEELYEDDDLKEESYQRVIFAFAKIRESYIRESYKHSGEKMYSLFCPDFSEKVDIDTYWISEYESNIFETFEEAKEAYVKYFESVVKDSKRYLASARKLKKSDIK